MKVPQAYKGRFFYHFTHVDNIESIVQNGLLSTNEKNKEDIEHVDLANETIQQRRSNMAVACQPYGTVHDYVPFYFTAPNPMLLSVLNRKNIDQPFVVYIAISIDKIIEDNVVFTDASANTIIPPNFYSNAGDLDNLNWSLIDSKKWNEKSSGDLHARMAEVLVYQRVPIDWIESYVVYNEMCRDEITKIYKENKLEVPKISYAPFNNKYFYFTKFTMKGRTNETLITGPVFLESRYRSAIKTINEEREKKELRNNAFLNINDALLKIERDFCVIQELEGIFELETDNQVHTQNVSDHTICVVHKLEENAYYKNLSVNDKAIVKLSAYLHDIGKGPKTKWKDEIQTAYPDHPADAIPMIVRILIMEFKSLSEYEIERICLLVTYHDIIGDIIMRGRSEQELLNLKVNENDLNMLIALTLADISSINPFWTIQVKQKLNGLIKRII